jgi:hypothetical protein
MAHLISRGRFISLYAFEIRPHEEGAQFGGPWVVDVDPSYVASLFQGWEKDVGDLIQVRVQPARRESIVLSMLMAFLSVLRWFEDIPPGRQCGATSAVLRIRKRSDSWGCRMHLFLLWYIGYLIMNNARHTP